MELLDIRDINGNKTGEVKERSLVHADGDLHGTSHVWITRQDAKTGRIEILLQKRAKDKDSFPGCYDISSAGHIPSGQDYLASAIRELEEELGIKAAQEELHFIGFHEGYSRKTFYGKPFINHEISKVYIYEETVDISSLILQEEEVQCMKWMDLSLCMKEVERGNQEYCLFMKELLMIREYYDKKKRE